MAISKIIYKTSPQDTGTVWMDATPATATASDITAPKSAMLADGVMTTGTGSGGGGGSSTVTLVPHQSINAQYDGQFYTDAISMADEYYAPYPYDGVVCTVTFDGVEYTTISMADGKMILGADDPVFSVVPFYIEMDLFGEDSYILTETSGAHTVEVTYEISASGGGGGLEYEEGTYTPAEDVASPFITFANAHTTSPIFVMIADATGTYDGTADTDYVFLFGNFYKAFGQPIYASTTSLQYATGVRKVRGSTPTSLSNSAITQSGAEDQYASNTGFYGDSSTARYYRAGRTYKWIAVWAPTV